jgi:hypothetical protein
MDAEVNISNLAEILKSAMSLGVHDRAKLAERLLASLEDLSEEEAEKLWAEGIAEEVGGVSRRPR